ncbi:MAG: DUF4230 domain-containing protein [Anaerolineales bacterium]|nr:DUF4230 domain-containing protein [Anaerolineales bacterium]MCA9932105.1 DUF4230 domain-containing protein [Anaerolineales bacterium]
MLRKLFYLFLIIFLILGAFVTYSVIRTINATDDAIVQPIGDLVRQLVVPATPVILPDPTIIVNQINDMARLETATVDMEKVITAERNSEALWGLLGETLLFVANGKVVAGVDFAEMGPADLAVVNPTTVMVHLPDAKIFDDLPVLDNEKSYVADRDTGLLTRADPELETEVRQVAEQTIREEAIATGVIERADENARIFMEQFLNGLGFETVIFTEGPPPEPEPYVQEVPKGQVVATPTPES